MSLQPEVVDHFFAWAPWVVFAVILAVVYSMTRGQRHVQVPIGQTHACAACGRRENHEHMVPVTREGAVLWYCERHAGSA